MSTPTPTLYKVIFVCFIFFIPFNSQSCHSVTVTETNAIDNGDGTYTYTFDICTGVEDSYGFFLTFTGANLITYPGSITGPTSGNTINASVPPISGSGDIEYGNWDSNAGLLYSSSPTNDCVSVSYTFDGSISQVDIGGTQAFYAGGPCSGSLAATTCFASSATYQIDITASNNNNQSYTFGLDGVALASGPTNGQTDSYLICGCASTFTVTASGSGSIPAWVVTQIGVGTVGAGASVVVNSPLAACTVLPIELIGFDVNYSNERITLEWSTLSERDNDYFTIERSNDGENWTVRSKTDGAGNSNEIINYKAFDTGYIDGDNYYRLKQTDYNGDYSYSDVVAFKIENRNTASVYPNPFGSLFHVKLNIDQTQISFLSLTDVSGREYYRNNIQLVKGMNEIEILTPDLDKGVYHLRIQLDKESIHIKIVKK
ncbi:MAG: T9SS type A sorting domain-containing protein [Crocinitomicaceae bacterium]|nr:T9SS type A sorting domain-containing protein [Flavobacteriales bacterium]NQZ37660.1 T9SS type A sorting domain-containing protein [Crocinitomicaceae bacterium]